MNHTPPILRNDLEHILNRTMSLWNDAGGKRMFITGGTGFFGAWLLESLAFANQTRNLGIEAIVLSRDPEGFLARSPHIARCGEIQWLQGDIENFEFPESKVDCIIHAATETSARASTAKHDDQLRTMVSGTSRVMEFARRSGAGRLLFTSSGAVYGTRSKGDGGFSEESGHAPDPLVPGSAYGLAKMACEHLCFQHHQKTGCHVSIARCFAFVGAHLPLGQQYAIGNFIKSGIEGRRIEIQGDGQSVRSYLDASDLMIWLWTMLFQIRGCRAFNVGSSNRVTIQELAALVSSIHQLPKPLVLGQRGQGRSVYYPTTERAKRELGLEESIGLRDAIRKTSEWYSNQRS